MNQLQRLFEYQGHQVRTIIRDGEPWFVAKDVCEIFGDTNYRRSVARLDDDEKGVSPVSTPGGVQEMTVVNEAGLYSLLFHMQPQKKSHMSHEQYEQRVQALKKFKRWVTHEVLPTIRQTGGYVADDDLFIQTYLPYADEQTKVVFRATLALVRKQNEQIAMMKPKAEYFDALVDRNLLTNFRDTAKELHIKQTDFINWLLEKKFIYRDQKGKLKPYAQYVPELFQLKEWTRNDKADVQTLITPKGRETFRLLYDGKRKNSAS